MTEVGGFVSSWSKQIRFTVSIYSERDQESRAIPDANWIRASLRGCLRSLDMAIPCYSSNDNDTIIEWL